MISWLAHLNDHYFCIEQYSILGSQSKTNNSLFILMWCGCLSSMMVTDSRGIQHLLSILRSFSVFTDMLIL